MVGAGGTLPQSATTGGASVTRVRSAVVSRSAASCCGVSSGASDQTYAASPATWGAACDVPSSSAAPDVALRSDQTRVPIAERWPPTHDDAFRQATSKVSVLMAFSTASTLVRLGIGATCVRPGSSAAAFGAELVRASVALPRLPAEVTCRNRPSSPAPTVPLDTSPPLGEPGGRRGLELVRGGSEAQAQALADDGVAGHVLQELDHPVLPRGLGKPRLDVHRPHGDGAREHAGHAAAAGGVAERRVG